jgi:carboxylesterase
LGTPVKLKYQWIISLRFKLYGRFRNYYRKPGRYYKMDYTDMKDEVTYPVIPVRSLGEFLNFLKKETSLNLDKVKTPVLVIQPKDDPVVHPESATYIYENLGSSFKKICWLDCNSHIVTNDIQNVELFDRIYNFVREIIQNGKIRQTDTINEQNHTSNSF